MLLDKWQYVPDVLGAVKRAVDERSGPGRFVLTGSAQADLTAAGWPATGRLIRVEMYGLAEREIEHRTARPAFLDLLSAGGLEQIALPAEVPDVRGYVARAMRGTFPEVALSGSDRFRSRWLASYVDQVVTRDVSMVGTVRDPARLRRYLRAVAASTAGVPVMKTLIDAAGIDRSTAVAYDTLLERLLLTESLPAWSSNRLGRLVRLPKRYLVDAAFLSPLLGVDARSVLRDGDLLGRVLDTFVVAQLRADCVVSGLSPRLFHVRDANGRHEVDILAEFPDGSVIGFEVKADAAPGPDSARHLRWLKGVLGDRFVAGAVLHTGSRLWQIGGDIYAIPICALWG